MTLMEQYSNIFGIELKEVQQWVNGYVSKKNWPENYPIEENKEDRINSIKEYMQRMVDDSVTGRVKASIIAERIEQSEVKTDMIECPF